MHIKYQYFFIVSNEVPEQPVISPVSGHIYEKRLIEKYIKENGSDPMNGEKLGIEMLVDVKGLYLFISNISIKYINENFKIHILIISYWYMCSKL